MAVQNYIIDPAHSRVSFSVKHMMVSVVRGAFTALSGEISVDPDNPNSLQFSAEIDANSFDTGNEARDTHIKSADFLDVAQYPTLTYKGSGVEIEDGVYKVRGDLTLHGVTKPITVTFDEVSDEVDDPYGNKRFGVSGRAKLNRNDFGITIDLPFGAGKVVGDEIKIEMDIEFVRQA